MRKIGGERRRSEMISRDEAVKAVFERAVNAATRLAVRSLSSLAMPWLSSTVSAGRNPAQPDVQRAVQGTFCSSLGDLCSQLCFL